MCSCESAVACLRPRNSISNVVASLTIDDNIYICKMYICKMFISVREQRLQISDLHFDKFPAPATFACLKIRFKTEVCTCSQFPVEAMQWIKEVELVDSVDDLRSSSSVRGISMPDFEVLDARIASALNKIIHNPSSKGESVWRNKRPRKMTVSFEVDRLPT